MVTLNLSQKCHAVRVNKENWFVCLVQNFAATNQQIIICFRIDILYLKYVTSFYAGWTERSCMDRRVSDTGCAWRTHSHCHHGKIAPRFSICIRQK